MKLGEALTVRARQAQQLNDLQGRIKASAKTQEGDNPPENSRALITRYLELSQQHGVLVTAITKTNVQLQTDQSGRTLADMLRERQEKVRERNLYGMAAVAATPAQDRWGRSEIKFVSKLSVEEMRRLEEAAAAEVNRIDAAIQEINWMADLAT